MFSKKQRLCKQKEIEAVFKGRISTYNQLFGLKVINSPLQYNRYTVVISTKVSKLAVERNRIKRIVKKTLKKHDALVKNKIDCVVITLKPAKNKDSIEIEKAIINLLKRTKLI
jgi:ribonuclease P protein component